MAISGNQGFIGRGLPPTGLAAFLARPGLRDALLATGSGLLAQRDQPGSLGGALGRALPMGMQALQQGQQKAQYEQMLASAPPEMRQLLTMLGPERGVPALMQLTMPKAPEEYTLGPGERRYRGADVVAEVAPEPEAPADPSDNYNAFAALSPEEQADVLEYIQAKRPAGVTVNTGERDFGNINTLADDFRAEAGSFREVADAIRRAQNAAESAVGDQTRIIALNKLLDPSSVVREGEFDRVGTAGGFAARAQWYFSKMKDGRLPADIRQQIDQEIASQARAARSSFQPIIDQYNARARAANLDPSQITRDYFEGIRIDAAPGRGASTPEGRRLLEILGPGPVP